MDFSYFNAAQHQPYHLFGLQNPYASTPHAEEFPIRPQSVPFEYNDSTFTPLFRPTGTAPLPTSPASFPQNSANSSDIAPDDFRCNGSIDKGNKPMVGQKSGRSNSEEQDKSSLAQSRRKAQNRAAQRAFRERKERRIHELEQRLSDLEQASSDLFADNERLKRELAKVATKNEILCTTSQPGVGSLMRTGHEQITTGPTEFSPKHLYSSIIGDNKERNSIHRVIVSEETDKRLLDIAATWDMIQNHKLFKQGLVDIGDVCERLKSSGPCEGQGSVFEEGRVRRAIEESVAGGNDELM